MKRLKRNFFLQPTLEVSQQLIGKRFHFNQFNMIITETEGYIADIDEACHAYKRPTPRNKVMFDKGGHLYVYFIYGIYYCLNVVCEAKNKAAAVLIRGAVDESNKKILDGPGKFCRYLGIDRSYNYTDIILNRDIYFSDTNYSLNYDTTTRIGISRAKDKLWRYVVSKKVIQENIGIEG